MGDTFHLVIKARHSGQKSYDLRYGIARDYDQKRRSLTVFSVILDSVTRIDLMRLHVSADSFHTTRTFAEILK